MVDQLILTRIENTIRWKNRKKILIVTSPFVEDNNVSKKKYFSYIGKLIREINKLDNINVAIKLHPTEKNFKLYKKVIKEIGCKNVFVFQGFNLYDLINESDLILQFGSTVAIEAIILGKPVITSNFCIESGNYQLIIDSKATYEIDHQEDISELIKKILLNDYLKEKREKAVKYICGEIDDRASERIAEIIAKNFD